MKRLLLAFLVAGCVNTQPVTTSRAALAPDEIEFVRSGIADAMKDPGSAQFRNWTAYNVSNGDRIVCGEVNAKNSFGAYVGFDPFYVRLRGRETISVQTSGAAVTGCNRAATGSMMVMDR